MTPLSGGVLGWRVGDLDAVVEGDTLDDLGQLGLAFQPSPGLRGRHDELEHHEQGVILPPEMPSV